MNFVFLSPNFPKTYYNFTQCLKNNGVYEMFDSFTNLSEDFTELDQTVSNALVELNHNLEVGLTAIETSLSNQLPSLAENVISAKIQAGELNCQLGTSYDSDDEELTFTIQVISGE